jgi:hypothetical protein
METLRPVGARDDIDAGAQEPGGRERQHDVELALLREQRLQEEDVPSAGRRGIAGRRAQATEPVSDGLADDALELCREARLRSTGTIDHVSGEQRDRRNPEHLLEPASVLPPLREHQARLAARRAEVAVACAGPRSSLAVVLLGFPPLPEQQCRLGERGMKPVGGVLRAPELAAAERTHLVRERSRSLFFSGEQRERGCIDPREVRVLGLTTTERGFVSLVVDEEGLLELVRTRGRGGRTCSQVLVGASEDAERLSVAVALGQQPEHRLVGSLGRAASRQSQTPKLPQPEVVGPAREGRLDRLVRLQRLPGTEGALRLLPGVGKVREERCGRRLTPAKDRIPLAPGRGDREAQRGQRSDHLEHEAPQPLLLLLRELRVWDQAGMELAGLVALGTEGPSLSHPLTRPDGVLVLGQPIGEPVQLRSELDPARSERLGLVHGLAGGMIRNEPSSLFGGSTTAGCARSAQPS